MRILKETAGWLAFQPDHSRFDVAFDVDRVKPVESVDDITDPDEFSWVSCESMQVGDDTVKIASVEVAHHTELVIRAKGTGAREIFAAAIADLLNPDTRAKFEVARQAGLNGEWWLAVSVDNVRVYPDSVTWVRVDEAVEGDGVVAVVVDGDRFEAFPLYSIVVRRAL